MKRVSFEVAKVIAIPYLKSTFSTHIGEEDSEYGKVSVYDSSKEYSFPSRYMRGDGKGNTWGWSDFCFHHTRPFPTYLEVWLWLWRIKGIFITFDNHITFISSLSGLDIELPEFYSDPEEAIIAAINYLVDNDLIK